MCIYKHPMHFSIAITLMHDKEWHYTVNTAMTWVACQGFLLMSWWRFIKDVKYLETQAFLIINYMYSQISHLHETHYVYGLFIIYCIMNIAVFFWKNTHIPQPRNIVPHEVFFWHLVCVRHVEIWWDSMRFDAILWESVRYGETWCNSVRYVEIL